MSERPEFVKCIGTEMPGPNMSWCGKYVGMDWHFQGANHAALAVKAGDRMMPCPECVDAAVKALKGEA